MKNDDKNVFERIRIQYNSLTISERKVADYILKEPQKTRFLSAFKIANACGVSEPTIYRFCHCLGYNSYRVFKLAISSAHSLHENINTAFPGKLETSDTLETINKKLYCSDVEALNQTIRCLDLESVSEAVYILAQAKRVLCVGQGSGIIHALEAWHLFSTVSNKFTTIEDPYLQTMAVSLAESGDVFLLFSCYDSDNSMIQLIKQAGRRKAKFILVTDAQSVPDKDLADIVLRYGFPQNPMQTDSISARIAQLYLIDILFTEFTRRNFSECLNIKTRIIDALADKHI